jgi:iron complex transport system permease protein
MTSATTLRRSAIRLWTAVALLLVALTALAALNLLRGEPNVAPGALWSAIVAPRADASTVDFLIRDVRIPRVLLAVLCGAALGVGGVLLQDSLRNPLADPGLLGVAQGASLVMALAAIVPEAVPSALPLPVLCLVAGFAVGVLVLSFGGTIRDPIRMLLAGVVLAAFFSIITSAILLLTPPDRTLGLAGFLRYTIGSLSAATWDSVLMVLPWLGLGLPAALLCGRILNLLQLGDETAAGAGLNPFRARLMLLAVAMVLVAPVIAAIGPVSFIALFAPHVARGILISTDSRQVLSIAALSGAVLLLAADVCGRLVFFPREIPAGIWTVAIVGPAAIVLTSRLSSRTA